MQVRFLTFINMPGHSDVHDQVRIPALTRSIPCPIMNWSLKVLFDLELIWDYRVKIFFWVIFCHFGESSTYESKYFGPDRFVKKSEKFS